VPYISSRFIAPLLLLGIFFLIIFGKGISNLNFPPLESLTNPQVYSEGFRSFGNFFELTPTEAEVKEEITTGGQVFVHRLPYFVFLLFSLVMVVLCFVKRLSLIPVLGVMSCTYLMTELGITNWIRFGIWLAVGFVIYFVYSYKHSKLHRREEAMET
jgi:basic amino acid/polyamine antiporter, APA family